MKSSPVFKRLMIALLYVFILHPQKLFPESVVGTLASKYLLILLFIDHFTSDTSTGFLRFLPVGNL